MVTSMVEDTGRSAPWPVKVNSEKCNEKTENYFHVQSEKAEFVMLWPVGRVMVLYGVRDSCTWPNPKIGRIL